MLLFLISSIWSAHIFVCE
jgi:hypothetical protein